MGAFNAWVGYYDVLQKGIAGDVEFYVAQALQAKGRTLEIGCGTGRICIPMAMSGVDVVGLDNSPAMLARCREKFESVAPVSGRLELVEADMVDFTLEEMFGFIAMPYRTFMHILNPNEQIVCLTNLRKHLRPDGLLILNTWAARPSAIAPWLGAQNGAMRLVDRYEDPESDFVLHHFCASVYDEWAQVLREDHLIQELDSDGAVIRSTALDMIRAWTTPREMGLLVQLAGFQVDAVLSDFAGAPFSNGSTEMIWVLRPMTPHRNR